MGDRPIDDSAHTLLLAMTPTQAAILSTRVTFSAVSVADFEEMVAFRIAAMRESLERVGRFDAERARERLRKSFQPAQSEFILLDGQRVGFYTFRPEQDGFHLDHLYVHPSFQSRGIGSHVLRHLLAQSDARKEPVYLGALRDSPSNRFYLRHGFIQTAEDEWDIYYQRLPRPHEPKNG
jgi:ribosomal protein S18 acetylase RimI-like enzyme